MLDVFKQIVSKFSFNKPSETRLARIKFWGPGFAVLAWLLSLAFPFAAFAAGTYTSSPTPGSTLTWPGVTVGSSSSVLVTVQNTNGASTLTLNSGNVTGSPDFLLITTFPVNLAPGASTTVEVSCVPSSTGVRTGSLAISTSDTALPNVSYPLNCNGTAPVFVSNPASTVNFGSVSVGSTGSQNIQISNSGQGTLYVNGYQLTGSPDFNVTSSFPFAVQGNNSQTRNVTVTCTPSATGPRTATLKLGTNDPNNATPTYTLTCSGATVIFSSNPTPPGPINLVAPLGTNASQTIVVSNIGDPGSNMVVSVSSLNLAFSSNVAVGQSFTVNTASPFNLNIGCTPSTINPIPGQLILNTNEPGNPSYTYNLTCSGTGPFYTSTPAPNATIPILAPVGGSTSVNITVINGGSTGTVLNVSAPSAVAAPISVTPTGPYALNQNQQQVVVVTCSPLSTATSTQNLTYSTNDPINPTVSYTIQCSGDGPTYTSNPAPGSTINIPALVGSSTTVQLTIQNIGTLNLTATPTTLPTAPVTIVPNTAITLPPTNSQTVDITCTPTALGTTTRNLVYTTNENGSPTYTYIINCIGAAPVFNSTPAKGSTINIVSPIGTQGTAPLTIQNTGAYTLTLSAPGGTIAAPISVAPNAALNIAPNTSTTIDILCTPTAVTPVNQTLTYTTNDTNNATVNYTVICTGTKPNYTSTPAPGSTINLVATIGSSSTQNITVNNTGNGNLNVTPASGLNAPLSVNPATNYQVLPGAQQVLVITCTPTNATLVTQNLSYTTDDSANPTVTYTVTCRGTGPAYSSVPAPGTTINLGVAVGSSTTANLVITNQGDQTLTVQAPVLNPATGPISVSPNTVQNIAPGASQTVVVTCAPTAGGTTGATLSYATNDARVPNPIYSIACTGYTAGFNSNPAPGSTINLTAPVGGSATSNIQVTNGGVATLNVSAPSGLSAPISVSPTTAFTLPGAGNQTIVVTCAPTVIGTVTQTLTYTTNDPNPANQTVTYTIICNSQVPGYSSTPVAPGGTINLGSAYVGVTLNSALNVQNTGTYTLTLSNLAISGPNAADFKLVSPAFPVAIAGSVAQALNLTCTPSGANVRTATLTFNTNDPNFATVTYTLTCSGIPSGGFVSNPPVGSTISGGAVNPNETRLLTLNVRNAGTANLGLSNPTITGPGAAIFKITDPAFPFILAPGSAERIIAITCTPLTKGKFSATLSFDTTDPFLPTVSYTLYCVGDIIEIYPADLLLQLTVNPDRVVKPEVDNLIAYTFKVKNVGIGAASYVSLIMPINENLVLGYPEFSDKRMWVTAVSETEVSISLPGLKTDEEVTGVLYFRPIAKPALNSKIVTRFKVRYSDPTTSATEKLSNSVNFIFGPENVSANNVQLLTPATAEGPVGTIFTFEAPYPAPEEPVFAWLTNEAGESAKIENIDLRATTKGTFTFSFSSATLQPGKYFVAVRGHKSGALGNATLTLTKPTLTPANATLTAGDKASFGVNYLAANETTQAWLTAADGQVIQLGQWKTNNRAELSLSLDSAALKLAPGVYTLSVNGTVCNLTGSARVEIVAKAEEQPVKVAEPAPATPAQPTPAEPKADPKPAEPTPAPVETTPAQPAPAQETPKAEEKAALELSAYRTSLTVGQHVIVQGKGFDKQEITVNWMTDANGKSKALSGGYSNANGEFALDIDTTGWTPGQYVIVLNGKSSGRSGSLVITVSK